MAPYKFQNLSHKEVQKIESTFMQFYSLISPITESLPRLTNPSDEPDQERSTKKKQLLPSRLCPARVKETKPALTVAELQARLQLLKGKPSLPYKEKLQKKNLKTRLRKKERKEKSRLKRLQDKSDKSAIDKKQTEVKHQSKPVYNTEGNLVFSKFDFSDLGAKTEKPRKTDPATALKKLQEEQKRFNELEESGERDKVAKIKEKKAWKNALLKVHGVKVKDNPDLLKTSIKKIKKRKEKSKAKWKAIQDRVVKDKEEKQRKRTENLEARSRDKKVKRLKTLAKKGRVIAGF